MDFLFFFHQLLEKNDNFISWCNVPGLKMTCQWKDKCVLYRLVGSYKLNFHYRVVFSSPRSKVFAVRIFSQPVTCVAGVLRFWGRREKNRRPPATQATQPVNSCPLLSLSFSSSWTGGILQFCVLIGSRSGRYSTIRYPPLHALHAHAHTRTHAPARPDNR